MERAHQFVQQELSQIEISPPSVAWQAHREDEDENSAEGVPSAGTRTARCYPSTWPDLLRGEELLLRRPRKQHPIPGRCTQSARPNAASNDAPCCYHPASDYTEPG